MPAQRMHRNAPVLMDAQVGRAPAPPPVQSAHARLAGSASSRCSAASCRLFSSIVTPLVSPAALCEGLLLVTKGVNLYWHAPDHRFCPSEERVYCIQGHLGQSYNHGPVNCPVLFHFNMFEYISAQAVVLHSAHASHAQQCCRAR